MKLADQPILHPAGPVRVEFQVQFSQRPKGRREEWSRGARTTVPVAAPIPSATDTYQDSPTRAPSANAVPEATALTAAPQEALTVRVPKITLLLVLGHHFERLVRDGVVKDYAEIARLTGLTRARVTQIVNLTLLAPDIQEEILLLPAQDDRVVERHLRRLTAVPEWSRQRGVSVRAARPQE